MSITKNYARSVRRQLRYHAAWVPMSDPYEVGDYGVFRGGVFERLGNIRQYGVDFTTVPGQDTSAKFTDSGVTSVLFDLSGGGTIDPAGATGDVEAGLKFSFSTARSFTVRCAVVKAEVMDAIPQVAQALAAVPAWNPTWRVVRSVHRAKGGTVLGSSTANAELVLTGKVSALQAIDAGHVSGEVKVTHNREVGIEYVGEDGPIGLETFRVRANGQPVLRSMAASDDLVEYDGAGSEPFAEIEDVDDDL